MKHIKVMQAKLPENAILAYVVAAETFNTANV